MNLNNCQNIDLTDILENLYDPINNQHGVVKFIRESPQGRFKLTNIKCGKGAFKNVFLAVDNYAEKTGNDIVIWSSIKIPNNRINQLRLLNEVKIMEKVNKKSKNIFYNLIGLLASWFDKKNKEVVIISEYASQGSLLKLMLDKKKSGEHFTNEFIVKIIYSSLKALGFLDKIGIIHRDIKPDNIVITRNGDVKIIDFGISTKLKDDINARDVTKTKTKPLSPQLTRQKSVDGKTGDGEFSSAGTPEYTAPEILSGEQYASYNEKVDIYSLGWTLYSLLSLEYPFFGTIPKPIDKISSITVYQALTYNLYQKPNSTNQIMDRELAKIAYCQEINKNCSEKSNLLSLAIPDMEIVNQLFDRGFPFPNEKLTFLDFFKDCCLEPQMRLSSEQLIDKYFKYTSNNYDQFAADYEGNYMSFGGK